MEIRRKVKSVVYKYSEPERLVREATSNDPWGPTSAVMSELAELSYNTMHCEVIMSIIWKRLNDKGKNWRHVFKCLVLLDYLIKSGDSQVASICLQNIHSIETLKDFQYFEEHKDLGFGVREKSKSVVFLLKDNEVLNVERQKGLKIKEMFHGLKNASGSHIRRRPGDLGKEIRRQVHDNELKLPKSIMRLNFDGSKNDEEDAEFQMAIALSKEEHELSMKRKMEEERREEIKLNMAIEQSKKENEALAILRLPPKNHKAVVPNDFLKISADDSSKKKNLYKPCEASRVFEEMDAFGGLDNKNIYDPWGSSNLDPGANLSLDFDPWKTDSNFTTSTLGNTINANNSWNNQKNGQNKNIIDDIFGEEKPNIQFDASWTSNGGNEVFSSVTGKENHVMDIWKTEPLIDNLNFTKNLTGSLADISVTNQDDKMKHSSSVLNLTSTRAKKTPQEFLGENASLVNLDNLLPASKAAQSNPFNSQTIKIKKPMNQMGFKGHQNKMFSSSGNVNMLNVSGNYNSLSQLPQPLIPNSQSQYQGFSVNDNPYKCDTGFWASRPPLVPSNIWITSSNNVTSNPFF